MTGSFLAEVRAREYPGPKEGIFFNAASYGLLPRRAAQAAAEMTLSRNRPGGIDEGELGPSLWRCRKAVARLLEVDADDVTLAPNTSYGVNLGAALVAAGEPGTVVVSDGEFAANVYPWLALRDRGFEVDIVPADPRGRPDEPRLMERIARPDVRAFALSAVQFATGHRADLEAFGRLCRDQGVLFVIDAIQALGATPLHPLECHADLVTSGGQKWLCSPWGSGFTWIAPEHRHRFDPPMVSWLAMEASRDFEDMLSYRWAFLDDGRKFELASLGIQDYVALAHSVELFVEMGVGAVREHIAAVHAPLLEWMASHDDVELVTPADPERRAGILAFTPPELQASAEALRDAGVIFAVREGAIRLSPHFYNTVEEMETVVGVLDEARTETLAR